VSEHISLPVLFLFLVPVDPERIGPVREIPNRNGKGNGKGKYEYKYVYPKGFPLPFPSEIPIRIKIPYRNSTEGYLFGYSYIPLVRS